MKLLVLFSVLLIISTASLSTRSQKNPAIEVPFQFIRNEPVAKVTVNGHGPLNMMLDTGTDPSAIDLGTAAAIGIKRSSKAQAASGGGTETNLAYECKFETLEIGGLTAHNVEAAAIDLSKISERMGVKIDGVLGYSLFKKRVVQFDYPAAVVRFFEAMPPAKYSIAYSAKFRYEDNVLIYGVMVNGRPVVANLDTGSSGAFSMTPKALEDLGLSNEAAKGVVKSSVGYNGKTDNREGTVANIQIGPISLTSPAVTFMSRGTGYDKRAWGLNIGNVFFKDYVVTFDYKAKIVRLERP